MAGAILLDKKRIIIGLKGDVDPFPDMKKIVRKTSYGMEIDLYDVPIDLEISPSSYEVYRIDKREIQPCLCGKDVAIILNLMENERFWECHEFMEDKWKTLHGEKKELLHLTIRLVVSQVKWQMGQPEVSSRIMKETLERIRAILGEPQEDYIYGLPYPIRPAPKLKNLLDQIYMN